MERSDQQLLQCVASGNEAAFGEFYDRHAPRVLGLLRQWLGGHAEAEDVLQETFWQVWCRAAGYDARRAPPDVWVLLIARSRALDYLRRQRPQVASSAEREPVIVDEPSRALERRESAQQIATALAQLPEEQRRAITLAFFEGLTHEQIARYLTIPLGTAKTRIRLGMGRLRDLLRGEEKVAPE
jgi:RNA polymerase sigma-70 factor (ECF subfamily)